MSIGVVPSIGLGSGSNISFLENFSHVQWSGPTGSVTSGPSKGCRWAGPQDPQRSEAGKHPFRMRPAECSGSVFEPESGPGRPERRRSTVAGEGARRAPGPDHTWLRV